VVVVEVTNTELVMGLVELVEEAVAQVMPLAAVLQLIADQMVSLVLEVEMVAQTLAEGLAEMNTVQATAVTVTAVLVV
jgi:hypothetical protein